MNEGMLVVAIITTGVFLVMFAVTLYYLLAIRPTLLHNTLPVVHTPRILTDISNQKLYQTMLDQRESLLNLHQNLQQYAHQTNTLQKQTHDTLKVSLSGLANPPAIDLAPLEAIIQQLSDRITTAQAHLAQTVDLTHGQFSHFQQQTQDQLWNIQQSLETNPSAQIPPTLDLSLMEGALDHLGRAIAEHWRAVKQMQSQLNNDQSLTSNQLRQMKSQLTTHDIALQRVEDNIYRQATQTQQFQLLQDLQNQLAELSQQVQTLKAAPPPSVTPIPVGQDRLTDIKGIGPVYSSRLYEAGVYTFDQFARLSAEEIELIIGIKGRKDITSWIEQARLFASQREKLAP